MPGDPCAACGGVIGGGASAGRPRRFCLSCRPRKRQLGLSHTRTCAVCGGTFEGAVNQRNCSKRCANTAREERRKVPCAICGTRIWPSRSRVQPRCQPCRRNVDKHEHGTVANYSRGCRCERCRGAKSADVRAYVARRRAEGRPLKRYGSSGPWIAPKVRDAVFERDGWACQLCGEQVDRAADPNGDWYPSLDHIVPQAKGGSHAMENLRTAHRWCNSIRGADDHHSELFEVA